MSKKECSSSVSWAGSFTLWGNEAQQEISQMHLWNRKKWACILFANIILLARKRNENANLVCKGLMRLLIDTLHLNSIRLITNTLQLYITFWIKPTCEIHRGAQVGNSESAATVWLTPLIGTMWKLQGHVKTLQATAESSSCKKIALFHTIKLRSL